MSRLTEQIRKVATWAGPQGLQEAAGHHEHRGLGFRVALALGNAAVVLGYLWAYDACGRYRFTSTLLASLPRDSLMILWGLCVTCALVPPLLPPQPRRYLQVLLSLVGIYVVTLWEGVALLVGFALLVAIISRAPMKSGPKIALALAGWGLVPVLKWVHLVPPWLRQGTVTFLWAGMAYGLVWVIAQRTRGDRRTVGDDVFYLLALPRVVSLFGSPMSQRALIGNEQALHPRLLVSGLLLASYSVALGVVEGLAHKWRPPELYSVGRLAADYLVYYTIAAKNVFGAMALFRLFGFAVPSGYRWPYLSQSFRDFFRSWNHYVRDAVFELFLLPYQGVLRKRLKSHLAIRIIATYLAIITGAYLMNDLLIPLVTYVSPTAALRQTAGWLHITLQLIFWSAIILPLEIKGRQPKQTGWRAVYRIVRFNILYFGLWFAFRWADWSGW